MSQHRHFNCTVATLAAAACLAFASGAGAAQPNGDKAFADSPTTICHPAYRPCPKEARPAATAPSASDTAYVVKGDFDHVAFGSACHPAYRPCANWPKSK